MGMFRLAERSEGRGREMAKFSVGGEDDGEGPSGSGPLPKRQRMVLRFECQTQTDPHPQSQPPPPPSRSAVGEPNDDNDEDDFDESEDEEEPSDREEDDDLDGGSDSSFGDEEEPDPNPPRAQTQSLVQNSLPPRSTAVSGSQGAREAVGSSRDGSITLTLVDPDVLDCSICFDPLCAPVYQCENGHIACSSCCTKIRNKCPSCSWPIGYNRCRAIEKVIESVKISCLNNKYGCNETMSYSKRNEHEKICLHAPCSCPFTDCSFLGSSKQLSRHFSSKHSDATKSYRFNSHLDIIMKVTEKRVILQEMIEDILFIISNNVEPLGNVVSVSCIGPPSSKEKFKYELLAKTQESSLKFVSTMKIFQGLCNNPTETGFLLIPSDFSSSTGQLKLSIYISRQHAWARYNYSQCIP